MQTKKIDLNPRICILAFFLGNIYDSWKFSRLNKTIRPQWFLAVSSGKERIEEDCAAREMPKMTFGQLLGLGRASVA
jgi:hypothetical protein